eukprot:190564-Rhodomonas_salina.3
MVVEDARSVMGWGVLSWGRTDRGAARAEVMAGPVGEPEAGHDGAHAGREPDEIESSLVPRGDFWASDCTAFCETVECREETCSVLPCDVCLRVMNCRCALAAIRTRP